MPINRNLPLPEGAPRTLALRTSAPRPQHPQDADFGIPVDRPSPGQPRHRLVTIGDSLTHGFKSLAITDTSLSWPAIVAAELGIADTFRYPSYPGPADCPGLPLNLEALLHRLEGISPNASTLWRTPRMLLAARKVMDHVEDYWETGLGAELPSAAAPLNHNLGIFGWDLRDAMSKSFGWCHDKITGDPDADDDALFNQLVSHNGERAALRALGGAGNDRGTTQVSAALTLGNDGSIETGDNPGDTSDGIETLVVQLGANNALATVVNFKLVWSADGYDDLDRKNKFTIWQPEHFAAELDLLTAEIATIRARHVIWTTVPHVTIAPLARGVGEKPYYSRYFPRYTRPWITDQDFDPSRDDCLTGDQMRAIDSAIDDYNDAIKAAVVAARRDRNLDWYLMDLCALLDSMAYRRYLTSPGSWPDWFEPYKLPARLAALSPQPDTRFFTSDALGRTQGGIIALDGVHPTTIGYGILAQEYIRVMETAGVIFHDSAGNPQPTPVEVDFAGLIDADTLITKPPHSLAGTLRTLGWLDEAADVFAALRGG
jgi:hypothetical protein